KAGGGGPRGGEGRETGIIDPRMFEQWQIAVIDGLEVDEPCDCGFRRHRGKPGNRFRRPTETRAVPQVPCAVGGPVRGSNRRKVLFPAIRHLVSLLAYCGSDRRSR